ncbi:M4 family metallopeptidase [Clostridium sp.]|uniref:M4 family metallopeptidase n=1 Tax=Clostridium sp. TaxID=1506 RepID=UPI002896C8D8|nr:M4 family metallopeptidase [Clostridium sp.]
MLKKKTLSIIILSSMLLNTASSAVLAKPIENQNDKVTTIENAIEDKFIFINKEFKEVVANEIEAQTFLMNNKGLLGKTTGTFEVVNTEKDEIGYTHFRSVMTGDGIPVYGSDIVVHVDKNNKVYAVNGTINENVMNIEWSDLVKISQEDALKIAKDLLNIKDLPKDANINPELYIYEHEGEFHVVYLVQLLTLENEPTSWQVFVNAENGQIVNKLSFVQNAAPAQGTGVDLKGKNISINTYEENGQYYLKDTTRLSNGSIITFDLNNINEKSYDDFSEKGIFKGTVFSSSNNIFNTERMKAAVSAHNNVAKICDYYKAEFNRDGIDGRGSDVKIGVHLDNKYDNAFWDPNLKAMVFGDGGEEFTSLAEALDVTAHEVTHGVINSTSNLLYITQSGALNEALADIMAVACENEPSDWKIGEDVYITDNPWNKNPLRDSLRNMQDPKSCGQAEHLSEYPGDKRAISKYPEDNGGVHIYSGIILKAAYNIGSQIGMREMGRLFYRANHYFTRITNFKQARIGTLQAALDLYGKDSREYKIVWQAFDAVGIK